MRIVLMIGASSDAADRRERERIREPIFGLSRKTTVVLGQI